MTNPISKPLYEVRKTYPHSTGLSVNFRQPNADSHCRLFHGYALRFDLIYQSETLDKNNWVLDFGSLKSVKTYLQTNYDHRTIVSRTSYLANMQLYDSMDVERYTNPTDDYVKRHSLMDIRIMDNVGCEAFAKDVFDYANIVLSMYITSDNPHCAAQLVRVECHEHEGNMAAYQVPFQYTLEPDVKPTIKSYFPGLAWPWPR